MPRYLQWSENRSGVYICVIKIVSFIDMMYLSFDKLYMTTLKYINFHQPKDEAKDLLMIAKIFGNGSFSMMMKF